MMIPERKYPSLPATGINPASFPLGSMESRAAIRALLLGRSALSDDDMDALVLYAGAVHLDATMKPSYRELEATAAYQRGAELCRQRRGSTVLAHLDQHLERSSAASLAFESVNGREPRAGDVLGYQDVAKRAKRGVHRHFHKCLGPQTAGAGVPAQAARRRAVF